VPRAGRLLLTLAVLVRTQAIAGEIPGLPAALPPYLEQSLGLTFSNDFLGRGGSVDDFRTQQIILTARPADRWTLLIDHSILTLSDAASPGRTDQLSASFGYDLVNSNESRRNRRLSVGAGFRNSGEFAGERMQNGFHRLVGSQIESLPYTATERTAVTAWFDAEYYTVIREAREAVMFGDWRFASWWRVNALATSDAQRDASAALYAVANRRAVDIWLGLRRDWRNGYDDPVQRATAAAEDDLAVVIGIRFGALVLETVQQLNNEASYGQLRLVSSGNKSGSPAGPLPRFGIEAGFLLPDVHLHLAGRTRTSLLTSDNSAWRESAYVSIDYGEPQHADSNSVFIRSAQLGLGLELQRPLQRDWLSVYGSVGAGWRDERLIGDGALAGERSSSAGSAVLLAAAGIRADASRLGARWNYRIQLGISGWVPVDDTQLQIGTMTFPVQEPALNVMLGMTFEFD